MLTYEEFMDKRHIVLDKTNYTFVMNRVDFIWQVWSIKRIENESIIHMESKYGLTMSEAYDFYKDRMASYGFKQFPIIME